MQTTINVRAFSIVPTEAEREAMRDLWGLCEAQDTPETRLLLAEMAGLRTPARYTDEGISGLRERAASRLLEGIVNARGACLVPATSPAS